MDKLLDVTMDFLYKNEEDMDVEQAEIVRYGLELLYLKASFFCVTMLIGVLMGSFSECLIFTILFSSIRTRAGGFHANSRMQCFIMSMLTFIIVLIILKLSDVYNILLLPLALLAVLSVVVIWKFAPIGTEHKKIDDEERRKFKAKARTVVVIELLIALGAYFFRSVTVLCSIMLALGITGILLILAIKTN